jgi:release factor glutamine methyltransferase
VDAGTRPSENALAARIIDAILQAERSLRNSGVTDTPRLEAEVLLADMLGIERARLIASYSDQLSEPERTEYLARIARGARGEPVAYITGTKEFMEFTFRVDGRALIPRPETETLVERAVEMVRTGERKADCILDIGAGCGCIAVSLALLLPHASVYATDISEGAVALARQNAERLRVGHRTTFYVGGVYSPLPDSLKNSFDLIVSNPPYVSDAEYRSLDRGIREFEPPAALRGGADGMDVFRRIAAGAADYLVRGGVLAVEIGESQAQAAAGILERTEGLAVAEIVRDLTGRQRVIIGRRTE